VVRGTWYVLGHRSGGWWVVGGEFRTRSLTADVAGFFLQRDRQVGGTMIQSTRSAP
jgi:hypothetical protein